jgi:hypothetical protein
MYRMVFHLHTSYNRYLLKKYSAFQIWELFKNSNLLYLEYFMLRNFLKQIYIRKDIIFHKQLFISKAL